MSLEEGACDFEKVKVKTEALGCLQMKIKIELKKGLEVLIKKGTEFCNLGVFPLKTCTGIVLEKRVLWCLLLHLSI